MQRLCTELPIAKHVWQQVLQDKGYNSLSQEEKTELREEMTHLRNQLEARNGELFKLRRCEQEVGALKRAVADKDDELEMLRRRVREQHVQLEAEMTAMEVLVPAKEMDTKDSGSDSFSRAVSTRRGLADVDFQMSEEDTEMFIQARRRFGSNKPAP